MKVFKASVGASCGSVVATQSGSATASWEVGPRGKGFSGTPSDQVEDIAGPRYAHEALLQAALTQAHDCGLVLYSMSVLWSAVAEWA